jgi:hypothetical protein
MLVGGVAFVVAAFVLVARSERPGAPPVAVLPAAGLPEPKPVLGPAPGEQPGSTVQWTRRLSREDDLLVEQAVSAGCDAERAAQLRALLAAKRTAREKTIADYEAGRINEKEMHEAARAAKKELEAGEQRLLKPSELEALDPNAARATVLAEERRQ